MPAVSVDTFFACSLMVIAVLAAMAGASKLLYPYVNSANGQNSGQRYEEISRYLLLNIGKPANWGQNSQEAPETFGLAKSDFGVPYELDVDKVTRLNAENMYSVNYAELYSSLKLSDVSFRLEIRPVFQVIINLTATFSFTNETTYQFEILTEKQGRAVRTKLTYYVFAENYMDIFSLDMPLGRANQNVTLSNSVHGHALLTVLARSSYDTRIVSFGVYAFSHNSAHQESTDTFVKLSPLNHVLNASFVNFEVNLSRVYALTFDHYSRLAQIAGNNESALYEIPHFLDPSPTILVLTGWNNYNFFTEWVAYPQVPLQIGADFANAASLSNVFSYAYEVTVNWAIYDCTVLLGGPRD